MKQTVRYAGVAFLALLLALTALWPFVSSPIRMGVLVAALVAYPIQLAAFFMLVRYWGEGKRFLLVWVGGTVARMGVLLGVAVLVWRTEMVPLAPTLLALAGFFFGLLLLEPLFLRPRGAESTESL